MTNSILRAALGMPSFESDDAIIEGAEINPLTEETTVAIDEILEEVAEGEKEAEEHDEAVEDLNEAADSLESLIASLESVVADGGMSPQHANTFMAGMAIATRRLPIDAAEYQVSVESFGGTGDKAVASMEALEGAKNLLKRVWEAIRKAVVGAWNAVKNFVQTIGKSAGALNTAGKLLVSGAAAAKGDVAGKKIDATSVARLLHVDGDFSGKVSVALGTVVGNGQKIASAAKVAETELTKLAGTIATGRASSNEQVQGFATILRALPQGSLPGGRAIEQDDNGIPKLVKKTDLKLAKVEIAVPDTNDIKALGQAIIKTSQMIADYDKKYFKSLQKSIEDFISKQDKLIVRMELEDKEETAKVRGELKGFQKLATIARSTGPEYMSYAAQAAKASFNFGKKALAAYKG